MSQNHTWRKITRVSPTDMTQLSVYWITRTPLPRPVRRRAVEAGILHDGQPPMFTHEGTKWMLEHAPRSKWSPPRGAAWQEKNPIEGSGDIPVTRAPAWAGPYR